VITADPIHPWSGGASYLYTAEYFRSAAEHLAPGGVICQWLPIYEMAPDDLRSVARTFASVFRHTAIWLTWYDAEMLGSSEPLVLDERRLAERMDDPTIAADLAAVDMGTPRDLLSYFLLGDSGVRAFATGGVIHTDDNLWLEFSTPRAQGRLELPARNVETLVAFRESPLASTAPLPDPAAEAERRAFWARAERAAALRDRAHVLGLRNLWTAPELRAIAERLGREFPDYAPGRFLDERRRRAVESQPRPVSSERFVVLGADGAPEEIEITAVTMRVGARRGVVVFVDNAVREVYAERYVDAPEGELDARLAAIASRVLAGLRSEYAGSLAGGHTPVRAAIVPRLKRAAASLAAG
jgi:spermidine synthase